MCFFTFLVVISDSLGQSCGLLLMTADEVTADIEEAMHLFDGLGLTVHAQKSVLQPVQDIEYLGFVLNSALTTRKKDKIAHLGWQLLSKSLEEIRQLAEFIGNLVAAEPGVEEVPLKYKGLEIVRNEALNHSHGNYGQKVILHKEARETIQWWIDNIKSAKKIIAVTKPNLITVRCIPNRLGCSC